MHSHAYAHVETRHSGTGIVSTRTQQRPLHEKSPEKWLQNEHATSIECDLEENDNSPTRKLLPDYKLFILSDKIINDSVFHTTDGKPLPRNNQFFYLLFLQYHLQNVMII